MERRLNKKIGDYIHGFKTDMAEKIQSIQTNPSHTDLGSLLTYVYEYTNFELNKDDFIKRKRVKKYGSCI